MGISVSLLLSAAGAVLIWAVNATVSGVNIHTVDARHTLSHSICDACRARDAPVGAEEG